MQEIGKVFLEFGVGCVIAVNSEVKISDEFATRFSELFYAGLINGNTIANAFESAISSMKLLQTGSCFTCCCGHAHKEWCDWFKLKQERNYSDADVNSWVDRRRTRCMTQTVSALEQPGDSTEKRAAAGSKTSR